MPKSIGHVVRRPGRRHGDLDVEIPVRPRQGNRPLCSACRRPQTIRTAVSIRAALEHRVHPTSHPVNPSDMSATIFHLLGIDVTQTFHDFLGRPHSICKGKPITGLVG